MAENGREVEGGESTPAEAVKAEQQHGLGVSSFAELLYLSTIRLLATQGEVTPRAGSAFVVKHRDSQFIVTAAHVIRDAESVTMHVYTAGQGPKFGAAAAYQIRRSDNFWHFHPDHEVDVAVGPFDQVTEVLGHENEGLTIHAIPTSDFVTRWEQRTPSLFDPFWRPLPLDEVLLVEAGSPPLSGWITRIGRYSSLTPTQGAARAVDRSPTSRRSTKSEGRCMATREGWCSWVSSARFCRKADRYHQDGRPRVPPNLGAAYKAHLIIEAIDASRR
jgi:hypothetical protein